MKSFIVRLITRMMSFRPALPLFNFLFENCGQKFRSFVIRNVKTQPINYLWKVNLLSNKTFNVYIDDTWRSWQFAYNYKWFNIGEAKIMQLLNDYYPIEDSYIDVGANLGLMTVYSAAIKRRGVLFEPNKSLNDFTRKQYAVNNYTNYVIENYCLSDRQGKATFYISGSSFQSSLNKEVAQADNYGGLASEMNVELTTLDHYLSNHPDIKPSIIKIDAEGHDFEVIKGAINTIKQFHPSLFVEVSPQEKSDIISFMEGLNYKYYGAHRFENSFLIRPENKKLFDACSDILFLADKELIKTIETLAK